MARRIALFFALVLSMVSSVSFGDCILSTEEITKTAWHFDRGDGSTVARRIKLLPGGQIDGHSHPNQSRWGVEGKMIVFYDESGKPSTLFNTFKREDGRWIISGPFLLWGKTTHVLRELKE